eukprot:TRINITY_DN4448_c0_g1_i1.p1 TRINITY_DN4448_c0_g1~~TRINITY_DN4448_c0_g1_i1.p1  ORF type:complete len:359 (-),score=62.48 TRINITY_DN4448_c0_g1_i1:358-1434(-)
MGCCCSDSLADRDVSEQINSTLKKRCDDDRKVHKLLLLGAGESGKSTLFKQMFLIYGSGFEQGERKRYIPVVYANVLQCMRTLCIMSHRFSDGVVKELVNIRDDFEQKMRGDEIITEEIGQAIALLWADAGIQQTFLSRSKFQLLDSADYFFKKIKTIATSGYEPDDQDILRARIRTTGIIEQTFTVGEGQQQNVFKMYDVGGQRTERKKWIHCFEDVTAVIFVAAMSEYDQVLYEDESTNRMNEALNLFEVIANSRWFKRTSLILFLNKRDLFYEKLEKTPLTVCFPDYKGTPGDFKDAKAYIEAEFLKRFHPENSASNKKIFVHDTCATDTDHVKIIFESVRKIVIDKVLEEADIL